MERNEGNRLEIPTQALHNITFETIPPTPTIQTPTHELRGAFSRVSISPPTNHALFPVRPPPRSLTSPPSSTTSIPRLAPTSFSFTSQPLFKSRRSSFSHPHQFKETLNGFSQTSSPGLRSINQYILSPTPLGKGAFAQVHLATDRETGVEFAVKEFSKSFLRRRAEAEAMRLARKERGRRGRGEKVVKRCMSNDEQGLENLALIRTEVAIMKKLDHPNIAAIYEVIDVSGEEDDEESDTLVVVMELCRGGPICAVTSGAGEPGESHGMEEERARKIFRQIILGISYLHYNDIIHRDIKPENILLLDDRETVKIVDFGVSEIFGRPSDDVVTSSTGSPAFMAPELLSLGDGVEKVHGFTCDLFAMGVTLYCLVVGRHPFAFDSNPLELFRSIKEDIPFLPPTLSPPLSYALVRLLDKNPSTRYTIQDLWFDPWITHSNMDHLPAYQDNITPLDQPTEEELKAAIQQSAASSLRTSLLVASAINKFKRSSHNRRSSTMSTMSSNSASEGSSSLCLGAPGSSSGGILVEGEVVFTMSPPPSPRLLATDTVPYSRSGSDRDVRRKPSLLRDVTPMRTREGRERRDTDETMVSLLMGAEINTGTRTNSGGVWSERSRQIEREDDAKRRVKSRSK